MSLDVNISEAEEFNDIQLHKYIEDVAKLKGFEDFEYHVEHLCGKGGSFISNVLRVLIKQTNSEEMRHKNVIVKTLVNNVRQELFHQLHKREVLAYNEVIHKFHEIQRELRVEQKVYLPKCYLSNADKGKEVLILEDLEVTGFEMEKNVEHFELVRYDHISAAVNTLAQFHGLSFVLQDREPDAFEQFKTEFTDLKYEEKFLIKTKLRDYFQDSFDSSLKVVNDLEARKILQNDKLKLLEVLRKYTEPNNHSVLCHGDFWINNVLYKHDIEGKPTDVCFIDFQAMRYASPVTDLLYFIYLCTESEFRSKHLTDIQNQYYKSLGKFLKQYSIDVSAVYPREYFDKDLKDYLLFGLVSALMELRIVTTTPEDITITQGSNILCRDDLDEIPTEINIFVHRVNDVVNEFVKNGVLYSFSKQ